MPPNDQSFDYVVVIESLRPGDQKTGTDLYDQIIRPLSDRAGIRHQYKSIRSKCGFFAFLKALASECHAGHHSPILHIECHGSENGLEIAGEFVSWKELAPSLITLNTISELNMLVCLAACSGMSLVKALSPVERAPAWGVLGPRATVDSPVLFRAFCRYYEEFLSSLDGRKALISMNGGPPSRSWQYPFTPALWFFKEVYSHYIRAQTSESALKTRAKRITREVTKRNSSLSQAKVQAWALKSLKDQRLFFEKFKTNFFMYDLYPHNQRRFPVSYSEVGP